jgi:sugar lactone lactonase YvrE
VLRIPQRSDRHACTHISEASKMTKVLVRRGGISLAASAMCRLAACAVFMITPAVASAQSTFTLGGTIIGLRGSGLTLSTNGQNVTIPANATSFTFPTAFASGTVYNVTMTTRPNSPTQGCLIANARGTLTANVTNIRLACVTSSFTLGGTVSGVSADAGLVLQNGSEELPVSRNGSFVFARRVSSGSGYDVTVKTQPTTPVQTCAVTNASGTMGSTGVADVVVSCDGIALLAGALGGSGSADGVGSEARFNTPLDVASDAAGNIFVADIDNHTIRKITATGAVSILAGAVGMPGAVDGHGSDARFFMPRGVATDAAGNVYVADYGNHTIRKITPAGVVSTLAGAAGQIGSADGYGGVALFRRPSDIVSDTFGNLYVTDTGNHTIRKISPAGAVSTWAGTAGQTGAINGTGTAARFNSPRGVAVDAASNVYVADTNNQTLRKISAGAVVTTFAGTAGEAGSVDGSFARFNLPERVVIDSAGNLLVSDTGNHTIRRITPAGVVDTLVGTAGASGTTDGSGSAARFNYPIGVTIDSAGNAYVADSGNSTIRKITPAGAVSTFAGAALQSGSYDGSGSAARFNDPNGIATDLAGNVYVADSLSNTIRKIAPAGVVSTLAGTPEIAGSADGIGTAARFSTPLGVATDSAGNIYVTDYGNSTIRKISPAGVVSTLAGMAGQMGFEDGIGSAARFYAPYGIATDTAGNVYVADLNHTIRKISPAAVVTTFAGRADQQGSADGSGNAALFSAPQGLDTDSAGNVYVADTYNHTIRKITPAGVVSTFAGTARLSGSHDGIGSAARFSNPNDVAVDAAGNVYVADQNNHTIRRITPDGMVTTVAGTPASSGVRLGPLPGSLNGPRYIALLPGQRVTLVETDAEKGILLITLP